MTKRENILSLISRTGYETMPPEFSMCPSLEQRFNEYIETHDCGIGLTASPYKDVANIEGVTAPPEAFLPYYDVDFKEGTTIDGHGIAHEPGSAAAFHMTRMYHPMEKLTSVEQILAYPMPGYSNFSDEKQKIDIAEARSKGLASRCQMSCTVWELAWYLRGMETLMTDMMLEDPMAEAVLDRVTESAVIKAEAFAKNGGDILWLGDDIGMQHSIMMSENLYCMWIKPRLKRVIDAARKRKPDIKVFYHSCGFVTPFIPHLIEVGIDILDPVQPECMSFRELHALYGGRLSFHGTLGTQTLMPFGTPGEVRRTVFENLDIAGEKGGLMVCPTHLLEPEVPVENIIAYIKACNEYRR
ncbi:MAG: uroporphyrinogen decarboxylase family protein [Oscillospiraceae bacterium]|nr:uroporphyrinogen decarboxylase family protein [Oscillospiraceae bacterium]